MNKIFFVLLIMPIILFGQEINTDIIKQNIKNSVDKDEQIYLLDSLVDILTKNSKPDEAFHYAKQMILLSKERKNRSSESKAYRLLSNNYKTIGDFDMAISNLNKSLQISKDEKDTISILKSINEIGRLYHYFEMFDDAILLLTKSIEEYKYFPIHSEIATLYSNLGAIYGNNNNIEKGIEYTLKASEIAEEISDYQTIAHSLYTLSMSYIQLEQYEKAEKYYEKAFSYSKNLSDESINWFHHIAGLNYSKWGKYDDALKHNFIALDYYKKKGNTYYTLDVLDNIAVVYLKWHKPKDAIIYSEEALKTARESDRKGYLLISINNISEAKIMQGKFEEAESLLLSIINEPNYREILGEKRVVDVYNNLSKTYYGIKQYKRAHEYLIKTKHINDSLNQLERNTRITEIETKYQAEKKEKENLQLKQEKSIQLLEIEKENKYKWIYGIGMLWAIIVLLIFAYYAFKLKKQKDTIEILQKELHHRVKNNLAIIDTFIEVTKDDLSDKTITIKLNELQNRIMSINEVHKQLHKSHDMTKLGLRKYLEVIVENIQMSFDKPKIVVNQQIEKDIYLPADQSFPVGLIINEFLTNSYKYGFPNNNKGLIKIILEEKNNHYHLSLSDDGIGLPKDFEIDELESFGMRVLKLLIQQLNGKFNIKSEKGVFLEITFPKRH